MKLGATGGSVDRKNVKILSFNLFIPDETYPYLHKLYLLSQLKHS